GRAEHRRGGKRRRQSRAAGAEPRLPAARPVHGADRALRPRGPAAPAGARGQDRAGRRGGDGVTRLTDLPPAQAQRLAELECPEFATTSWVSGPPLRQRRVAIVSSAGLVVRGEEPFRGRDPDYRIIPGDIRPDQLLISH